MLDQEILADFVAEAREHLETIEPSLLELEKNPENLRILDDIFRPMHSLKGASGFLDLNKINELAHTAENILDALRKGKIQNQPEIMDVILSSTDCLRQMLDNLENAGEEGQIETKPLVDQLQAFLSKEPAREESQPAQPRSGKQENHQGNPSNAPANPEEKSGAGETAAYALTINSPEHLSDFLEEARESISALNSCLLALEKESGDSLDYVQEAFRYFHNLKGNSGLIGHLEMNRLTHNAETLLNQFRSQEITPDAQTVDLLLQVVDILEDLIEKIDQDKGQVFPKDIAQIQQSLQEVQVGGQALKDLCSPGQQDAQQPLEPACQDLPQDLDLDPEDLKIFQQTISQQLDNIQLAMQNLEQDSEQRDYIDGLYRSLCSIQNACRYMGFEEIEVYAQRTAQLVDQGRSSPQGFAALLSILQQETEILQEMLQKQLQGLGLQPAGPEGVKEQVPAQVQPEETPETEKTQPQVQPAKSQEQVASRSEPEPAENGAPAAPGGSQSKTAATIRVDHEKLDHLMNLIGELIINRNRFSLLSKELEALDAGQEIQRIAFSLSETTDAMARISDDLQDTIMQVRMVPVRTVFSRFPRLVRDLSRKSGKQVELLTEGEETELDKSVVEAIGDPLVHLIRNAVDHGLEDQESRQRSGKPKTGRIWLRASQEGNSVVIQVEDDGQGLDPEKIKAKAVNKEIISQEEADKLEEREAVELIFAPGFSTANQITDVSGRGVGMDVVRNNIKGLNGSVSVQSELGQGSKFVLSLPLTLAIIEALMVKVAGNTFAIPLDAVDETTKIEASKVSEVNKRQATTLRGEVLGLAELAHVLGLQQEKQEREVLPLVVISVNNRRLGLVVDSLLYRQEIVIKSMGEYLGEVHGLSGATIMGDGSVILILDPNEILSQAMTR
ncbi:MAG: Hpt domain-containing protein [Thermodesulfobacteriota bacterium]